VGRMGGVERQSNKRASSFITRAIMEGGRDKAEGREYWSHAL